MADKKSAEYWGEEIPPSEVVNPVVFNFKPNQYVKVAPDHLRDWEQLLVDNVGLRPVHKASMLPAWAGSPGGSISGSNDGWDD